MDFAEILSDGQRRILRDTQITTLAPGSIARELLEIYATEASRSYGRLNRLFSESFISNAAEERLDELGKLVGMIRQEAAVPFGQITITIDPDSEMTLNDLKTLLFNNGVLSSEFDDIILPAGISLSNQTGDSGFYTSDNITLSEEEAVGPITSESSGAIANVGPGEITVIDLENTEYASIARYLIVKNDAPIDNGQDDEDDDNYRYRIVNALQSHARGNIIAIRLSALEVPGVNDVFIRNYESGIGTFNVYVVSESPVVSNALLNAVQEAVNVAASAGIRGIATNPDYEAVHLSVRLRFEQNTASASKDLAINVTNSDIVNYINNLDLGERLTLDQIRKTIFESDSTITDIEFLKFGRGDYNTADGIIDNYEPLVFNDQLIPVTTKWVSNKRLVEVCYA